VLVTVKGKPLRDGLQPPLTVTARGGRSSQVRTRRWSPTGSNKEMRGSKI